MVATEREKLIYGSKVEIVSRVDNCTVYRLCDDSGYAIMTSYLVFPGIELIYNDVHTQSCEIERAPITNLLEINHCLEGRIECAFKNEFCYLEPGDLAITMKDDAGHGSYFPLKSYKGISIVIDINIKNDCISNFLQNDNFNPRGLIDKFCRDGFYYLSRSNPAYEHIFSELYNVPESIRESYMKVKVLELLIYLSGVDAGEMKKDKRTVSLSQASMAKSACKYLTEHMDSHITIEELSMRFHVSGTLLKSDFKNVYGVSIYSYIRTQKMQSAARMLKNTEASVLDVANRFGYNNGSKFAAAFKAVIGMTPKEYRTV